MADREEHINSSGEMESHSGWPRFFKIAALVIAVIVIIVFAWVKYNIYASKFIPVKLSLDERMILDSKLNILEGYSLRDKGALKERGTVDGGPLEPERYTEEGARREISLTERELNSIIADDPDVARMVAIDLSDDLVSIKLVIPVDEDVVFLGGKTLRIKLGIILGYKNEQPVVALKGISLGGIPLPNAWLGYLKNENLVEEFGSEKGFWRLFAEGVQDIRVREGHLMIRLKE